jgi:RES domain-containing protein
MTDIKAVRIIQNKFASKKTVINGIEIPAAFSGEGASQYGGRWNSIGTPIVYTAGNQPLAILEVAVHVESPRQLEHYSLFEISFNEDLVLELSLENLPEDWQTDPAPESAKAIGDQWVKHADSLILKVPSTIVSDIPNYIINPYHPDLNKLNIIGPIPYPIDPRIKQSKS